MSNTPQPFDPPWFYLGPDQWRPPYALKGREHHHLHRVLRLGSGERIACFDGKGRHGVFSIESVDKSSARLTLLEERIEARPEAGLSLALAWTKNMRRSWLLEKCVELEAEQILFWQSGRSVGRLPEHPKQGWFDQLVSGAKQSGNPWLPELLCISGGMQGLARAGKGFDQSFFLWEKCGLERLLDPECLARPGRTLVVLGPEGGLEKREAEAFQKSGFESASLGQRILRWETAALVCLGLGLYGRNRSAESQQE